MSLLETLGLLEQAQADLEEAERVLVTDPTDEFAQMSVGLFRSEVESFRQIVNEEQRLASGVTPPASAPTC